MKVVYLAVVIIVILFLTIYFGIIQP